MGQEKRWAKCISVGGTMSKSDEITRAYSVVKCDELQTF